MTVTPVAMVSVLISYEDYGDECHCYRVHVKIQYDLLLFQRSWAKSQTLNLVVMMDWPIVPDTFWSSWHSLHHAHYFIFS